MFSIGLLSELYRKRKSSEIKRRSVKMIQSKIQGGKWEKIIEYSMNIMWENVKQSNVCIVGLAEGNKSENEVEKYLKRH